MTSNTVPVDPVALIFDLDGVLTDTAHAHAAAWRRLAARHDLTVNDLLLDSLRGRSRADSLAVLLGDHTLSPAAFDALLEEKNAYYRDAIAQLSPADVLEGAREAVNTARSLGVRTAVGSASKNARFVLDRLELTALFHAIVDGNEVRNAKPHPDVFLTAANRLHVAPKRCAVIEDAASGIEAAHAAQMLDVGVGAHLDPASCTHHVTDLTALDVVYIKTVLENR